MKIQAFTCIFSQSLNYELYILNYALNEVVGQNGLEPSTSRLSVVCSSQLSYWPVYRRRKLHITRFGHLGVQSSLTALRLLSKSNPSYFGFDLVPSHFLSGGD